MPVILIFLCTIEIMNELFISLNVSNEFKYILHKLRRSEQNQEQGRKEDLHYNIHHFVAKLIFESLSSLHWIWGYIISK